MKTIAVACLLLLVVGCTALGDSGDGEADAVGPLGCDAAEERTVAVPQAAASRSLTYDEALEAPEMDPSRLIYIGDALVSGASPFVASAAELEAARGYLEVASSGSAVVAIARSTAGRDYAGTWLEGAMRRVATAGDVDAVAAALGDFARVEVVPAQYGLRRLRRVARRIDERAGTRDSSSAAATSVVVRNNVVAVRVASDSTLSLRGIPCPLVEVRFDDGTTDTLPLHL